MEIFALDGRTDRRTDIDESQALYIIDYHSGGTNLYSVERPNCYKITPQYASHFTTNLQQMDAAPQDILLQV